MAQTAEELEAQRQAAEEAAAVQVEEAAQAAKDDAVSQGLSEEEVKERVEKARKEEKDKLYPQLEGLKDQIKTLQDALRTEQEERQEEERKKEEEKEKRRIAKLSDEEKQQEQLKKFEEQLREEREARHRLEEQREKDQAERAAERRQDELNKYKETVLGLAGDKIIPELVYGNSEEEIDKAVERAKAKYEEIADKERQARGQRVRDELSGSTSPATEALEDEELEGRLSAVDTDKYLKDPEYREQIKDQLEGAYRRAQGR